LKNEITNFLIREYTNCVCFVDPLDVKMLVSKQCYSSSQYKQARIVLLACGVSL